MATKTDRTVTILDHIDNITVPGNAFQEPVNEYWALICLQHGMEFLYDQVHRCDQAVKQQVNPDGNVDFFAYGNFPAFKQISETLLTCAFHWYAISACQYVKTVGAIARNLDPTRPLPHEYAKSIIPNVIVFRDKVAAHFAWTTENRRDNDAGTCKRVGSLYFGSDAESQGRRRGRSVAERVNGFETTAIRN